MPILVHVLVIEAGIAARIGRRCWVLAVIVEGAPVLLDRVHVESCRVLHPELDALSRDVGFDGAMLYPR